MAEAISKNYEVVTSFGIYTFTVTSDENGFTSVGNIRRNGVVWTNDYPAEVHAAIQNAILEIENLNGSNPQNFLVRDNLLSEIADLGAQSQLNARTNLGISDISIGDLVDVNLEGAIVNGKMLQAVDGVFVQVDPPAGGGGGGFTQEEIEDFVGAMLTNGGGITWTYDDANSQISGLVSIDHLSLENLNDVSFGGAPLAGQVIRYDGVGFTNVELSYNDLTDTPSLGTSASKDAGVGADNVLLITQANTLPAISGQNLTSLPSINLHSDVNTANIQNGETLVYNNGSFIPGLVSSVTELNDLDDVTIGVAQNGNVLFYSNGQFINQTLASTDLTDTADLIRNTSSIGSLSDVNLGGVLVNGKILQVVGGELTQVDPPNTGFTQEEIEDFVGSQFVHANHSTGITFSYDDPSSEVRATLNSSLQDISNVVHAVNNILISDGLNFAIKTPAQARTALGLEIGTNVQAQSAQLTTLSNLNNALNNFIVGDGNNFVIKSGQDARTALGLGTASVQDENAFLASGSGLNDLADVTLQGNAVNQFLVNDGLGTYSNKTISTTDLSNGLKIPLLDVNNELVLVNIFKPNGGINVNNVFVVDGVTGNTSISGTLGVDGLSSMEGGINVVNPNTGANSLAINPNGNDVTVNSAGGNIDFLAVNLTTTGTFGAGETTITALNTPQIKLVDNLAEALVVSENGNDYLTFVTTNADEKVIFGKVFSGVSGSTVGNLVLEDNSITTSNNSGIDFGTDEITLGGNLIVGNNAFIVNSANGNTGITGTLAVSNTATFSQGLSVNNQNIGNVDDIQLNSVTAKGNTILINVTDNQGIALKVEESTNNISYIEVDTTDGQEEIRLLKPVEIEGTLLLGSGSIQDTTGTIDLNNTSITTTGNLTVENLTVNGVQNINNQNNLQVNDSVIELNAGFVANNNSNDLGLLLTRGAVEESAIFFWDEGLDSFRIATHSGNINVNTTDFDAVAGLTQASFRAGNLVSSGNISATGTIAITGTGSITAPAQAALGNQIVTAGWVRGLTINDLTDTTENVQDIAGAQFVHANHSTGITFTYTDDGGVNDGEVSATLDATLQALAGVNTVANQIIYSTAPDTFSTSNITAEGRTLIASADPVTTLGLVIGTDVQAQNARLAEISAIAQPTADNFLAGDGNDLVLKTPAQARTSLGLDQVNARNTLGFGTAVTNDTGDFLLSTSVLNNLNDVTITNDPQAGTPLTNQVLIYTANGFFENVQLSSNQLTDGADLITTSSSINDLPDVDTNGLAEGKILTFNAQGHLVVGDKRLEEEVHDFVGNLINAGNQTDITVTYDDQNDKIDFSVDATIARIDSPTLTGTPLAPTPNQGTNNTQIATTAFVQNEIQFINVGGNFQPVNDRLTEISAIAQPTADNFLVGDGNDIVLKTPAQSLLSLGLDQANARNTLGFGTAVTNDTGDFLASGSSLDDLSDVTIAGAANGELLVHNGATFANRTISTSDLSDGSDIPLLQNGDLSLNGSLSVSEITLTDNLAEALVITENGNDYLTFVTTDAGEKVVFGKEIEVSSGATIGTLSLSGTTISSGGNGISFGAENLTTTGSVTCTDLTVSGTLTTVNTDNLTVKDRVIELNNGIGANNNTLDIGLFFNRGTLDDALVIWDEGEGAFVFATHSGAVDASNTTDFSSVVGLSKAPVQLGSLDVSGSISATNNLTVTGTGSITAPAANAVGNEIVTAGWVKSLTISELTDTTEDIQDIAGAMFDHANHSAGVTFVYDDNNNRVDLTLSSNLQDISGLGVADGNFIVGDGNNFVVETPAQVRTSLGLDQANARVTLGFGTAVTNDTGDFLASGSGLDDLSDVTIAVPANKHFIVHNGVGFENRTISTSDLSDGSDIPLLQGGNLTLNGSLSVSEITLTDNLAEALVITENGNDYLTFVTTDAGEKVVFGKEIEVSSGATIGTLSLSGTTISSGGNGVSFGAENLTTTGDVTVGNNLFTVAGATGNTSIGGALSVTGTGSITAPAANAVGNEIVTAGWVKSLTISDLTDTTEDIQDIAGAMFDHANHSTGLSASYDDNNNRVDLTLSSNLQDISGLGVADGNFIVGDGNNFVVETPAQVRASLGLEIGTNVQAQNDLLDDISGLNPLGASSFIHTDAQGTLTTSSVTTAGLNLLDDATTADQRATLGLGSAAVVDTTINGGVGENGKAIVADAQGKLGALDGSNLTNLGSINTHSDVNVNTGAFVGDEVLVWDANAGEFISTILSESARDAVGSALEGGTHSFSANAGISFTHDDNNNVINLEIGVQTSNLIDVDSAPDTHKQVLRYSTDGALNKYVPTVLGTATDYDVGINPNEILLLSSPSQSNVNAVADLVVFGRVIETIDYGSVGDAFVQNTDFATDWNGTGFADSVIYAEEDYGVLVS